MRSLNLNVKQVPEDVVSQAITFLKQGKSVWEMEELTGLSNNTVRRGSMKDLPSIYYTVGQNTSQTSALFDVIVFWITQ
ncbi:hypothetical protein G6F43_013841 [Rhizopus delemar]|nr:hypothetical protein G6F43_013841 [Rhizopus delemar]